MRPLSAGLLGCALLGAACSEAAIPIPGPSPLLPNASSRCLVAAVRSQGAVYGLLDDLQPIAALRPPSRAALDADAEVVRSAHETCRTANPTGQVQRCLDAMAQADTLATAVLDAAAAARGKRYQKMASALELMAPAFTGYTDAYLECTGRPPTPPSPL